MHYFKYIIFLSALNLLWGCEKYLSEEPAKQASIQNTDQLEAIINNNTIFVNNTSNEALAYSSDDTNFPMETFTAFPALFGIDIFLHYTFNVDQIMGRPSDAFWNTEYRKILNANVVLENADKVSGPNETKNQLKADARLFRAFSYWQLANHYCLPYNAANAAELGLPLKTQVDYGESLQRSSLKETYDFIEADLREAYTLAKPEVDPLLPWRASKKAVEAMLSRFYLFTGNYEKCLENANLALGSQTVELVDLNTLVNGNAQTFPNPVITLQYSELNDWPASKYMYWKEFYFTRLYNNGNQWQMPSEDLITLYDQANDMRFKWFMIPNGNRRFFIQNPVMYRYTMFHDGRVLPIGPTIAEMLLNKAEALARTNNIAGAMQAVNQLREKRMSTPLPLAAANQAEAIARVLEERRREMPFAMRWYDIRRFNANDYVADDVTITRTFFTVENFAVNTNSTATYTLTPGSRRFAIPINTLEILASQNQIEQNNY